MSETHCSLVAVTLNSKLFVSFLPQRFSQIEWFTAGVQCLIK